MRVPPSRSVLCSTANQHSHSTTDGGQNFVNRGMNDSNAAAMLSIRMGSSTWGIAGGLGFMGLPCGAYTNDGETWMDMSHAL